jgi:hypothetical protein
MRKIILTTMFLMLLSSAGYGADWKLIGTSWETDYYYDPQSIQLLSKDIVRVWMKKIYAEKSVQEYIKGIGPEFKELSYDHSLIEFNCSEKKNRLLTFTYYNRDGGVISTFTSDSSSWNFIVPNSILEALFNIVCSGR